MQPHIIFSKLSVNTTH